MKVWQMTYIHKYYFEKSSKDICEHLGLRQKQLEGFVYSRRLVKSPNWSNVETNLLIIFKPKKASELLNRNYNSCKIKYHRLCKKNKRYQKSIDFINKSLRT